uniref:Uncharacterized protein n=1 Tax=Globisporangium ultimum (strain ATCC 200006 / CBS 805.95 / DAOM BR144) TaxID=431595 RepID=K3WUF6_GLOUD
MADARVPHAAANQEEEHEEEQTTKPPLPPSLDAWLQTWSQFFQRALDRFLRETYGHPLSVQTLAVASAMLLLSCLLYFLSPLLEDDYHIYQKYLPWVYYLDYGQYNSFVVDHVVVFLAISLPMGWLLLWNVAYSRVVNRLEVALLLLRIACCLTVCFSLTVILTEFLSRRVMIALLAFSYGALGLVYSWSVPVWRWYLDEATTKGLIAFLPESVQELLLRTSLLEWMTDTTMSDKIQPFLPFLLPLSRAEQTRLLERMPVENQLVLTRPGLLPLLPESVQKALLPSEPSSDDSGDQLVVHRSSSDANADASDSSAVVAIRKVELSRTADAGFAFHHPDTKSLASQSSEDVLVDIISNRVWTGCKQLVQMPSSKTLNRTASVSTALFVLQLYASRKSRQMFVTTLQFLMTSAFGSVAACAILLRVFQLTNMSLPKRPLLRYAQQYLLRNRSTQAQLEGQATKDDTSSALRKAATSASVVLAVVYAMRKLRG